MSNLLQQDNVLNCYPIIAKHKPELKSDILSKLHKADISIYEDSMQSLVYKDIQKSLKVIQKS